MPDASAPTAPSRHLIPFALALTLGAAFNWRAQSFGLSPWHMVLWPALLAALALVLAALPIPRLPQKLDAVLALPFAGLLIAQAHLSELVWNASAVIAAAFTLRAIAGQRSHLAALLAAPLGLIAGLCWPVLGLLGLLLFLLPSPAPSQSKPGAPLSWVLALGAGALGASAWVAARPLDPTLWGLATSIGAFSLSAALSAQLTQRLPPRPILLSLAALGTWMVVAALPNRAALWIEPLAGVEDPRLRVLLLLAAPALPAGLAAGAALGPAHKQGALPWLGVALVVGAAASLLIGPEFPALFLGLTLAGGLLSLAGPKPVWLRFAGVFAGVLGGLIFSLVPLDPDALASLGTEHLRSSASPNEARSARDSHSLLHSGWSANGSWLLYSDGARPVLLERDGLSLPRGGRAAAARLVLPHLGVALSAQGQDALILGDPWGELSAGLLAQEFEQVSLAVPQPELTRALAEAEPALGSVWLHPAMRLLRGNAEEVLRKQAPVDLILEDAQVPWRDGLQGLPTSAGLALRAAHLKEGGAYVLVVPALWMEDAELRAFAARFSASFPNAQVFLPPEGADQLIFAGWTGTATRDWDRVVQASVRGGPLLGTLNIQSPLDLADLGLAPITEAWAEPGSALAWQHLGPTLHRRPRMLPPLLLPHLDSPSWLSAPPEVLEALAMRQQTNQALLECLDSAARGQVQDVMSQCRDLGKQPGGERRLDPLIAPQLEAARAALLRGDTQGCLREVEQARLLNPNSAQAQALAGRCRLATGDARSAREDFERAVELEPANLEALLGLAQLAVTRGEDLAAERTLLTAAQRNPRNWRPPYYLGMLLLDQGRLDDADLQLASARALAGRDSTLPTAGLAHVAILQQQPQLALTQARLAADQEASARNLHLVGWAYLELGSPEAARPFLERAVLADSNYLPAHADLGRIFAAQGDYGMAIDAFDRVLALEPGNPAAIQNRQRAVALLEQQTQGAPR